MQLLATSNFERIFEGLQNKVIGFLALDGNVGDLMIQRATQHLFDHFGIAYYQISDAELGSGQLLRSVDEVVVSGGGNMGTIWQKPYQQRQHALRFKLPITIFPQSFGNNGEQTDCYRNVFVRERASLKYCQRAILAPDMALAMKPPRNTYLAPLTETGLFLRKDQESCLDHHPCALVDPVYVSKTVDEYLALASLFEKIITDRLHFAIAGLILGREVTLLPNGYHKNRSMYETWLKDLGCSWLENTSEISYDRERVESQLWKRLGGSPSEIIDWAERPVFSEREQPNRITDFRHYVSSRESYDQLKLQTPGVLESLCNGQRSLEGMVLLIAEYFPERRVSIALDIQSALKASSGVRMVT